MNGAGLYTLLVATIILGVALFFVGQAWWQRDRRRWVVWIVALLVALPGVMADLYYLHLFDSARWYYRWRALPGAEYSAAGAGLLAGVMAAQAGEWRRVFVSRPFFLALLIIGLVVPYVKPLASLHPASAYSDQWQDDVCLQTTSSSCGAACAATILRQFKIVCTEAELARECFTSRSGTENWYLARAFQRRGLQAGWRQSEPGLPPSDLSLPVIAGVKVGGAGHFIVVLEDTGTGYVIGDPLGGRKVIAKATISRDYWFTGFFMEVKPRSILR